MGFKILEFNTQGFALASGLYPPVYLTGLLFSAIYFCGELPEYQAECASVVLV